MKIPIDIDELTEDQTRKLLKQIIECLDELDGEDYFGTEGWRHRFGFDD